MAQKKQTPAPIDRPLSRAYLREFSGWSTNYPPGLSEPTSLRLMENVQVQRDGALRIRPGVRAVCVPTGAPTIQSFVGTQEPFFLAGGRKAYLQAVRELDGSVGFRVLANLGSGMAMHALTDTGIDFIVTGGAASLNFTTSTTYVKYLQIDNKIFALSNAGESMRYFTVGTSKTAKRLNTIERPAWDVSDKLTVVQPTLAWINSGVPVSTRYSSLDNQSFETNVEWWLLGEYGPEWTQTVLDRSTTFAHAGGGSASGRLATRPWITNWHTSPMYEALSGAGIGGWGLGSGTSGPASLSEVAGRLRVSYSATGNVPKGTRHFINGPVFPVPRQEVHQSMPPIYWAAFDFYSAGVILSDWSQVSCLVRHYDAVGNQVGSDQHMNFYDFSYSGVGAGGVRLRYYIGTVPSGATQTQIFPNLAAHNTWGPIHYGGGGYWEITNVRVVNDNGYGSGPMVPGVSANTFWAGPANASRSDFHPPNQVLIRGRDNDVSAGGTYTASYYVRAATTPRNFICRITWRDAGGTVISTSDSASTPDVNTGWTRISVTGTAPAGAVNAWLDVMSASTDVPRGEYHYIDHALFDRQGTLGTYYEGGFADTSTELYDWATGVPYNGDSRVIEYSTPIGMPTANTPTVNTLIGNDAALAALDPPKKNDYNFGFFYTFANEVGESAASQITVVKAQRGWSQWKWELANSAGEPNGTHTDDPDLCADQLVAYMPAAVYADAMDQGATSWNLYMLTWSDQDPAPVAAVRLGTRVLPPGASWDAYGYLRMTPQQADANAEIAALPSEVNRFNYSAPSRGGNGIVAADRLVMVYDPSDAAVVRWSSAEMGKYSNFTANKGGGFKTLSSGNLNVPAAVKLWQNPQSADTITILCLGTDSMSASYYMAPAQIASQSEAVNIMGFEETTATPGTTSPYGVEVLNNALYHPLEDQLMKSTAMNYNITHSTMTDPIQDNWLRLINKDRIISAVHDNRIYLIVHNPRGAPLETGCWGNEVWVFDAMQKMGSWSRWLVQGVSLRRVEVGDQTYMAITQPSGLYLFDPLYTSDDFLDSGLLDSRAIDWSIETNTQGANRAHDAWAHLQQLSLTVGNFIGQFRYGVRGYDLHGKVIDISKIIRSPDAPVSWDGTMFDLEDFLQIRRDMKEWFFYAGSVEEEGVVQHSEGQISLAQYRYTPSTVNTGYEYGSIETFEYGRAGNDTADRNTVNGVPMPMIDVGRP